MEKEFVEPAANAALKKKPRSYWTGVSCHSDRDRSNIRTWFSPLCDDMTVESAEILCDIETDREKKIRAVMVDATGKRRIAIRAKTKDGWSVTLKATSGSRTEGPAPTPLSE